ncbi:MAG: hypothetical protein AAGC96_21450, partial [Pseudomonadota bacterium]
APAGLDFEPVATLTGKASVRNGYELLFGHVEVRLRGIAAPHDSKNSEQEGGKAATQNLQEILSADPETTCFLDGNRADGKPVALCMIGWKEGGSPEAQDLGQLQVEMGFALDCPRFSGGAYADAEKIAIQNGDILSDVFNLPAHCTKK